MDPQRLTPGDAALVDDIVKYLKAKGIFDEFRQECLADMDTKSSFQNLNQRIDGYTMKFLANETWNPDMSKNELRNKLKRSIEESGILDVGADHVVEQVITSKIRQVFFPRITDVVHQYIKEQNELSSKMYETASSDNASSSEKGFYDMSDSKTKSSISDPIADILSFSYSKSKPIPTTSTHVKTDSIQFKHADLPKLEKTKKEKTIPVTEKSTLEIPTKNAISAVVTEIKSVEKEKLKIESEPKVYQDVSKHVLKEEFKCENKKTEDVKAQNSEAVTPVEENKTNVSIPVKPLITEKKDFDKNKPKLKTCITQKPCSSSSEIKKPKKELSDDKPSDKVIKNKPAKSLKELSSPKRCISSMKSVLKEEKTGENSKSKSFDASNTKTKSSVKKDSKSGSIKKDSSKHKGHSEKTDKSKIPKSSDKNDQNIHYDSSNSERAAKNTHYSSSHDSSQGSDQEKSSSSSSKKEKQKHFSKHVEKEKTEEHSAKSSKTVSDKNRLSDADESPKKFCSEKSSKHEKLKDTTAIEVAKLSSCSNSFGSTSSVSSSPNASKDNLSNSDDASETSVKEKKKKQVKEKDSCQNPSKTLPSPPPPPPPSSSSVLASSAEMSVSEETQSSSDDSEVSNSEGKSEESSNVSESESKDSIFETLNKNASNSSTYKMNDVYDIFLYSSSSSEFEGFLNSPERENTFQDIHSSELSVSSVHTSDLSSYDDELSDETFSFLDESNSTVKKKLTLKKAQELFQNKPTLFEKSKNSPMENTQDNHPISFNEKCIENVSIVSCDKESPPAEPTRSLRRERKLNPRYASSEYTSIFNCKKETFITKRSSPPTKSNSCSSPNTGSKCGRKSTLQEKKLPKKCLVKSKMNVMHQDEVEQFQKSNNLHNSESYDKKDVTNSNEMNSILKNEMFQENNKCTGNDHLKINLKLNLQKNSESNRNSYSIKYKVSVADESSPVKRLCNQGSELIPNENKPFNSEKQSMIEEKILGDDSLKGLGVTVGIKKDLFCKQRANNNGDVLGQKDIFSNNSHGKTISNAEKKTSETGTSKELNAL